jgi:2-amino-4-hydroxy-6-hydroxymethyldihydropteridine diphosphokinase
MRTLALIGLGSNLGNRKANLDGAVEALRETPGITVQAISSFHETRPVGGPSGQGDYLNAAAALETTLDPFALLHRLQEVESNFGRVRAERWGPRSLDLDLLLYDDLVVETAELTVPHPAMSTRRFVLEPLAEISPTAVHPRTGRTIAEMIDDLNRNDEHVQERFR